MDNPESTSDQTVAEAAPDMAAEPEMSEEPKTPVELQATAEPESVAEPAAAPARPRDWTKPMLVVIAVLLAAVVAVEFVQLQRSSDLRNDFTALEADVTDLKPLIRDVDVLSAQVASLDDRLSAASASAATATAADDGSLPQYESSSNDAAVSLELPEISGPEYYSGEQVDYLPADGTARLWLIWAHWCPHCQNELPTLNTWWPENESLYPDVEIVSVTTAIDESRGNPLEPYLDTEQFSFPVIVDESGEIAAKFGTTAFPFWVVTDADGKVAFRIAGEIGIDAVQQIVAQLETMTTES